MSAGLSLCSSSEMTFSMYGADRKQTFGRDSNFTKKNQFGQGLSLMEICI
jgi:hypothetical protein